jgi:hypothetical protein
MVTLTRDDEAYWLERARDARAEAEQTVHPDSKRILLGIEAAYQRMALQAKARTRDRGKRPVE